MRNISASLTAEQIMESVKLVKAGLAPTKDVTRRLGWLNVKVGERLQVCRKCMGRKPGEPLEKLAVIEVVSIRREPLNRMAKELFYGIEEVKREGFSYAMPENHWPAAFVRMFVKEMHVESDAMINRIEFKYIV